MKNDLTWQHKPHHIPLQLQEWLLHRSSFIERLKNHGIKHPEIIVLNQKWEKPSPSERKILTIPFRHSVFAREVLIKSVEGAWMIARAIFPKETVTGCERRFLYLRNRSLGSVLFKYPNLHRSEFEFASLPQGSSWHEKISKWVKVRAEALWARRSLFTVRNKVILLSEIFLPGISKL